MEGSILSTNSIRYLLLLELHVFSGYDLYLVIEKTDSESVQDF